jgi:hypothetical protein
MQFLIMFSRLLNILKLSRVFYLRSELSQSAQTEQALTAIDTAAKNMSNVVNALEEKIRGAVGR